MTIFATHGVLAVADDPNAEALATFIHWFVVVAVLLFVVAPALWLTGAIVATRSLKKWPSLVADTEDAMYRWALLVGVLPVVGPLMYAVSFQQAKNRRTPEQLVLARMTHRERHRQAQLAGIGRR